jgi:DNA-binding HxlR family transcriptional regulator
MLARTLDQVGDRWTLLVVRDLLGGPRRFTDLIELLGGITPKTLTQRLRELEEAGIVEADRVPGRREVWYRLTAAGEDLAPAIEALFRWGLRHARRPPAPGERVHPEHLLKAVRLVLAETDPPARPLAWRFDVVGDGTYTLRFDGDTWTLTRAAADGDADADVAVTATTDGLTRFLTTPPAQRGDVGDHLTVEGGRADVRRLTTLLARFPGGG